MDDSDNTKDLPINVEFPELDQPGCNESNYIEYIIYPLLKKGCDSETLEKN